MPRPAGSPFHQHSWIVRFPGSMAALRSFHYNLCLQLSCMLQSICDCFLSFLFQHQPYAYPSKKKKKTPKKNNFLLNIYNNFRMLFFGVQMCVGWYLQMHAPGVNTYSGIPCRHWTYTSNLDKDERREWRPVITEGRNLPLMTVIDTLCLTSRILSPVSRNFSPRTRANKCSKC